ncbi:MAG TPA: DUF4386 domain-containing protein [Ktedonobacterales bacterium]
MDSTHQTEVAQTRVSGVDRDQPRHAKRQTETKDRKAAIVVGLLFITATVANVLSTSLTSPLVNAPDYLAGLPAHETQVRVGALLALIPAVGSASIAIALYPVLKRYHAGLALGAVGFRLIEAVFYVVDIIGLLALVTLGQALARAGAPGDSYAQTIGSLIEAGRQWATYVFGVSAFSLGALMYYAVLYQTRLIPRWLAGWGIVAVAGSLTAAVGILFGLAPYSLPMIILVLPIAIQEMALALWLVAKGFAAPAITTGPALVSN